MDKINLAYFELDLCKLYSSSGGLKNLFYFLAGLVPYWQAGSKIYLMVVIPHFHPPSFGSNSVLSSSLIKIDYEFSN